MARVFDEADYRARLDQAAEISTPDEARLVIKGIFSGDSFGLLNAQKQMNIAKQNALRQARKQMMQAIRAEDDKIRATNVIPQEVQEIVTGQDDELVQVP